MFGTIIYIVMCTLLTIFVALYIGGILWFIRPYKAMTWFFSWYPRMA